MRKLVNSLLCLIAIAHPAITIAQQSFTLTGTLAHLKIMPSAVYLKSMENNDIAYKVPVVKGNYLIKGKLNGPTQFNIMPVYSQAVRPADVNDILFVYLEEGKIHIEHQSRFSNLKVTGSAAQKDYEVLKRLIDKRKLSGEADSVINEINGKFVKEHPSSPIAVYALKEYAEHRQHDHKAAVAYDDVPLSIKNAYLLYSGETDIQKASPLFDKLPDNLKRSSVGEDLYQKIEMAKLDQRSEPYRLTLDSLVKLHIQALKQEDTGKKSELEVQMKAIQTFMYKEVYVAYIKDNPSSPIAPYLLGRISGDNFDDPMQAKSIFDLLSDSLQHTSEAIEFKSRLSTALKTAIGQTAPDFTQPDSAGRSVFLSSYRGKYVLLDFWASWCHPCREENPNMLKLYNQYKDKGFTILSVSLDTDRKNWLNAIKQDGLPWAHVSDLKSKNEAAKLYDILGIPANILIDPDGKVAGKNLFGELLGSKLAELIK